MKRNEVQGVITNLKQNGYYVDVLHVRNTEAFSGDFNPKGGTTIVEIRDFNQNLVSKGTAKCSPKDNYNKKRGVQIALGKAWKRNFLTNK